MSGTLVRNETSPDQDGALGDAKRWGIPLDRVPRQSSGVWPEAVAAVTAFLRVAALFRFPGPFGGAAGLDYGGVRVGLEMAGIDVTPELWSRMQCVEAGAIAAIHARLS